MCFTDRFIPNQFPNRASRSQIDFVNVMVVMYYCQNQNERGRRNHQWHSQRSGHGCSIISWVSSLIPTLFFPTHSGSRVEKIQKLGKTTKKNGLSVL